MRAGLCLIHPGPKRKPGTQRASKHQSPLTVGSIRLRPNAGLSRALGLPCWGQVVLLPQAEIRETAGGALSASQAWEYPQHPQTTHPISQIRLSLALGVPRPLGHWRRQKSQCGRKRSCFSLTLATPAWLCGPHFLPPTLPSCKHPPCPPHHLLGSGPNLSCPPRLP